MPYNEAHGKLMSSGTFQLAQAVRHLKTNSERAGRESMVAAILKALGKVNLTHEAHIALAHCHTLATCVQVPDQGGAAAGEER